MSSGNTISDEFSRLITKMISKTVFNNQQEKDLKDYVRLVIHTAKPFVRQGVELEDLVCCGIEGLIEARNKFDPEKSKDFRSFAQIVVLGKVYSYCRKNSVIVYVPSHVAKVVSYVRKIIKSIEMSGESSSVSRDETNDIITTFRSEFEKKIPEPFAGRIRYLKERIANIAKNSYTTYTSITELAKYSLISTTSDAVLSGEASEYNPEDEAQWREINTHLRDSLGPRKMALLELRARGHSNAEIAKLMYEEFLKDENSGYVSPKGGPISRAAVKNLIDSALKTIRKMRLFERDRL